MVNNKNEILDAGEKKNVPEYKITKMKNDWIKHVEDFVRADQKTFKYEKIDPITFENVIIVKENDKYIEPTERYKNFKKKFFYDDYTSVLSDQKLTALGIGQYWGADYMKEKEWIKNTYGYQNILDYMGIIPFSPSIMFNISPNWKGNKGMHQKKEILQYAMEKYLNSCNRYDYWECVIECGGGGDFVHAHAVAHINPAVIRSVIGDGRPPKTKDTSHIGKGNHKYDIQKIINSYCKNKCLMFSVDHIEGKVRKGITIEKGIQGLVMGEKSVQRIILRNEDLVKDKLNYLKEELKPEGHKNAEKKGFPLLFTSKDITENEARN